MDTDDLDHHHDKLAKIWCKWAGIWSGLFHDYSESCTKEAVERKAKYPNDIFYSLNELNWIESCNTEVVLYSKLCRMKWIIHRWEVDFFWIM